MNFKVYLTSMLLSVGLNLNAGAQTYTETGDAGDWSQGEPQKAPVPCA